MPVPELSPKSKQHPSDAAQSRLNPRDESPVPCRASGDRNDIVLIRSEHDKSSALQHRTEAENATATHNAWGSAFRSRQDFVDMHFS